MNSKFIEFLGNRLSGPLPGVEAQLRMAPPMGSERYLKRTPTATEAAVLLLLYGDDSEWHTVFIERPSNNPLDKHAGQISLPGGRYEEEDRNFMRCALRESYEEIGVLLPEEQVLGALTPLYIYASDYMVYPFVAFTEQKPDFVIQESEVKSLVQVPAQHFVNPTVKYTENIAVRNIIIRDVPCYNLMGKRLWGATAMIMSEFEHLIQ
jgi:8-oxo-dGTP pyrophosphatase MutT (NUDIX family)